MIRDPYVNFTPEQAQAEGTNVQRIKRVPELKKWLFLRIVKLSEYVDAGKRLQSQEEYQGAVEEILHKVPTLTLEEIEIVFRRIETGAEKFYNRLKMPEIIGALIRYDAEEASAVRESRRIEDKQNHDTGHQRISQSRENSFLCLSEEDLLTLDAAQKSHDSKKST